MSLYSKPILEHMRDCTSQYASVVNQLSAEVLLLEKERIALQASHGELQAGYQTLLDDAVDMRNKYSALQTSHEDLVDALHRAVTEMKFLAKGHADVEIFIAEKALTNAAKLAPTK